MGILKDLLEFFILTKGINSGGNNSGGPGTGPGPGSGPNPRPEAGPIANDSPFKRRSTETIDSDSDSDSDSDTPNYPDGSPEQNRIDEELLNNGAIEKQQVSDEASDEASDEDTDFPNVESPDVQLRRDED